MSMNKVIVSSIKNTPVVNLLDNSNFLNPINQRGLTEYSGSGYTIDRWRTWNDSATLSVSNNGITINNIIWQYADNKVNDNTIYTVAAKTSDGVIEAYSGKFTDTPGGARCWINKDSVGHFCVCLGANYTYIWAALYEGEFTKATLPPYQPKDYVQELKECQRYYVQLRRFETSFYGSSGDASGGAARLNISLGVPLRNNPTVDPIIVNVSAPSGVKNNLTYTPSAAVMQPSGLLSLYGSFSESISSSPTYLNIVAQLRENHLELSADL